MGVRVRVGIAVGMAFGVGVPVIVAVRMRVPVRRRAMLVRFGLRPLLRRGHRHAHVDIARREAVPLDLLDDEFEVETKRLEGSEQSLPGQAQVEQRAHEHIARGARERVEMKDRFTHARRLVAPDEQGHSAARNDSPGRARVD